MQNRTGEGSPLGLAYKFELRIVQKTCYKIFFRDMQGQRPQDSQVGEAFGNKPTSQASQACEANMPERPFSGYPQAAQMGQICSRISRRTISGAKQMVIIYCSFPDNCSFLLRCRETFYVNLYLLSCAFPVFHAYLCTFPTRDMQVIKISSTTHLGSNPPWFAGTPGDGGVAYRRKSMSPQRREHG